MKKRCILALFLIVFWFGIVGEKVCAIESINEIWEEAEDQSNLELEEVENVEVIPNEIEIPEEDFLEEEIDVTEKIQEDEPDMEEEITEAEVEVEKEVTEIEADDDEEITEMEADIGKEISEEQNTTDEAVLEEEKHIDEEVVEEKKDVKEDSKIEMEEEQTEETLNGELYCIGKISFDTVNLRTSEAVTFKGKSGKVQMLIFGGISSCGKTNRALGYIDQMAHLINFNQVNVYAFDIKNNSLKDILLEVNNFDKRIKILDSTSESNMIVRNLSKMSSFTMPLIVYLDAEGNVYASSTGEVEKSEIIKHLKEGGVSVADASTVRKISGNASYSYAYQMLDLLNEIRTEQGIGKLQMDGELLEAAMQRAAECFVSYSYLRPDGSRSSTISSKIGGENIGYGYSTPEYAIKNWMETQNRRDNLLFSAYRSVGIGCVKIAGVWYWVQCFSGENAEEVCFPSDGNRNFSIKVNTGWKKDGKNWYYLNKKGEIQTSWVKVSGKWYYMNGSGVMQTGWVKVSGKWYYMNSSGAMQTGWVKVSGKWYYMNGSGVMQTGWVKVSGKWYYMNGSGVMQIGWQKIGSSWYYMDQNGVMQTGKKVINGKTYVFNQSGKWVK